jgi:DNA uptake protein ComE-like DNA-binding protein
LKSQRAGRRRGTTLIFATALMTITFSADSQQTTAPAKTEPAKTAPAQTAPATQAPAAHPPSPTKKPEQIKKVDINNATLAELRALPLGEAEAKKVIAHRPYKARGELMTKAGLPEGVYFTIKDKLELQAPRKPAPKK